MLGFCAASLVVGCGIFVGAYNMHTRFDMYGANRVTPPKPPTESSRALQAMLTEKRLQVAVESGRPPQRAVAAAKQSLTLG